jgi:hypothetical protein
LAQRIIGIDFDNTIVCYNATFYQVALERQLIRPIDSEPFAGKKRIRDMIRQLPDGENRWQELQSLVYGTRMREAVLIEGIREFVLMGRAQACQLYIISHKTEFANVGNPPPSLHQAAFAWMEHHHFFEETGLGFSRSDVFFGSTRAEKLDHIRRLGCTHFIDDLEEVFLEPGFPAAVQRILYAPQGTEAALPEIKVINTWRKITEYLFPSSRMSNVG